MVASGGSTVAHAKNAWAFYFFFRKNVAILPPVLVNEVKGVKLHPKIYSDEYITYRLKIVEVFTE